MLAIILGVLFVILNIVMYAHYNPNEFEAIVVGIGNLLYFWEKK